MCLSTVKHYNLNIFIRPADNNFVSDAVVISLFAIIAVMLFPIHVDNYLYMNTRQRYAGANVTLYRLIPVFNLNTVSHSLTRMRINGRERDIDKSFLKSHVLKIYNNLTITKIVQLGDYGMPDGGAYAAAVQNALSCSLYSFVRHNGGRTKLRNYMILNRDHAGVVYYAKISGVVNIIALIKLIAVLTMEKIHE